MELMQEVREAVDNALEHAVKLQEAGDFEEAEFLYRSVLNAVPGHAVARYLHGQVEGTIESIESGAPAMSYMLNAFKAHQTHYTAVLPYNLNWMLSDLSAEDAFLTRNPIVVADIGARGGYPKELAGLQKHLTYYGFDADQVECERLAIAPPQGFSCYSIFPYYVAKENGPIEFNLYRNLGESSRLRPNKYFQKTFNPDLLVERVVQLEGATLDTIIENERLLFPEFIKLDTQGTELEVLQGSPKAVSNALMAEIEVEFTEMYENQPLFHDIARYMHEKGFELLYLNRVFQTRPQYQGEARGQITFGDALFGRRPSDLDDVVPERLAKYAILLANYGYIDIAEEMWSLREDVRLLVPSLSRLFHSHHSAENRKDIMEKDKLLCRQLWHRRTNQNGYDSDRSWPFR